MSKRDNHWYLVGSTLQAMGRGFRTGGRLRWVFVLAIVGAAMVYVQLASQSSWSPDPRLVRAAPFVVTAAVLGGAFAWALLLRARTRAAIVAALRLPTPDALLAVFERSRRRL
jgi:hypothetical protein